MALSVELIQRRALRQFAAFSWFAAARGALLAVMSLEFAIIFWTVLMPGHAFGAWGPPAARQSHNFAAAVDPFDRLEKVSDRAAVVTQLQLTLFGTRMNDATGRGSAIIAGPDGVQSSYSIGDEIVAGARLQAVAFDHVAIDRGGSMETLYLDQSMGSTANAITTPIGPTTGPMVDVARASAVDPPISIAAIRAGIGFIPQIDGGQITGLAVRPEGDGALFRQIGLKPGDVITRINGKPVTNISDLEATTSRASAGAVTTLSVMRGNETLPLAINMAAK